MSGACIAENSIWVVHPDGQVVVARIIGGAVGGGRAVLPLDINPVSVAPIRNPHMFWSDLVVLGSPERVVLATCSNGETVPHEARVLAGAPLCAQPQSGHWLPTDSRFTEFADL